MEKQGSQLRECRKDAKIVDVWKQIVLLRLAGDSTVFSLPPPPPPLLLLQNYANRSKWTADK